MGDQPQDARKAEPVLDEVLFTVKGVGDFKAQRLTGRMTMAAYKRRDQIVREEYGYTGDIRQCPDEVAFAALICATLELIHCECIGAERMGIWQGCIDSQDDVLFTVYNEYMKARSLVPEDDEAKKDKVKNS